MAALTSSVSANVRLQNALNQQSITVRCSEITTLLAEVPGKDAVHIFRSIVESLFLVPSMDPWGLSSITWPTHKYMYESMRHFLRPKGPVLSFAYRLVNDPHLFEFPITLLPVKTRTEIEEGMPSIFYANRIQNLGPGKLPANILLNSFEFYIFHFARFLVDRSQRRLNFSWMNSGDAIYPIMLEDYLREFLPCDSSEPPGPSGPPPATSRNAVSSPRSGSMAHNFCVASMSATSFQQPSSQLCNWTSQVVLQVLMEMWVIGFLPISRSPIRSWGSNSQLFAVRACSAIFDNSAMYYWPNWPTFGFPDVIVPTVDHVRMVRMLVKHLHCFSTSMKIAQVSLLDDMRRCVWPMFRKNLFQFLVHCFNHWPLDSSFRLVLELWLSYIQPWRYTDWPLVPSRSSEDSGDENDILRALDPKWEMFIAENLIFYSALFRHFMQRLLRLDLTTSKNAMLLYRVAKVFSQSNLSGDIKEVEAALEDPHMRNRSNMGTMASPISSQRSGADQPGRDINQFRNFAAVARNHLTEMECSSLHYENMFGAGSIIMVQNLLVRIKAARTAILKEHPENLADCQHLQEGWISGLWRRFTEPASEDSASREDARRAAIHLEMSQCHLCTIFNVLEPLQNGDTIGTNQSLVHDTTEVMNTGLMVSPGGFGVPDQVLTPNGPVLTNRGRLQLLRGFRRTDLRYEGNPDLRPIGSSEVKFLVRWFHMLCCFINSRYGAEIMTLYYSRDFLGTLSRLFLQPPETCYPYNKPVGQEYPTRAATDLPPRLSLRYLARKKVVLISLLVFFVIYKWSVSPFVVAVAVPGTLALIFCLWVNWKLRGSDAEAARPRVSIPPSVGSASL